MASKIIFTFYALLFLYSTIDYYNILHAESVEGTKILQSGLCDILQGPVNNVTRNPNVRQVFESFNVGGEKFSFSDKKVTYGMHNLEINGVSLVDGMYAKVCYVGDLILKVDILR